MVAQEMLEEAIDGAIDLLLEYDSELFHRDVCERALSHKFAMYLQRSVEKWPEKWDVDCEFNRNMKEHGIDGQKQIDVIERCYALRPHLGIERTTTVFPDVIIHRRGPGNHNLLVIEMKKSTATANDIAFDQNYKLPAYIHDLKYRAAAYITFEMGDAECTVEWIKKVDPAEAQ